VQAAEMMKGFYRRLPDEQAPAFREMFRRLADGQAPLAFNCTAGKDRTGLAAALILTLLGVPRETVVADYAATDRYLDPAKMVSKGMRGAMAGFPAEVSAALLRSDPAYIAAALAEIDGKYGSVEGYATQVLGMSRKDMRRIQKLLLEV
jgi:protein-tyrosine phosphatase